MTQGLFYLIFLPFLALMIQEEEVLGLHVAISYRACQVADEDWIGKILLSEQGCILRPKCIMFRKSADIRWY